MRKLEALIFQFNRETETEWEYLEVLGGANILRFRKQEGQAPLRQFSAEFEGLDRPAPEALTPEEARQIVRWMYNSVPTAGIGVVIPQARLSALKKLNALGDPNYA